MIMKGKDNIFCDSQSLLIDGKLKLYQTFVKS
jgi:hypothetical protein